VLVLVRLVVVVAVLGIVPLGLRLVAGGDVDLLRRVWLGPAALACLALWLPRGGVASVLCLPYLALTLALALAAGRRVLGYLEVLRGRGPGLGHHAAQWSVEAAVCTAMATPVIGASALVAERAGYRLFGFELDVLTLTVAHFHVAGFAAALVAALVARASGRGPLSRAAALCVPGGTLVVLAGFFLGDAVELAGAVVLTAGMWAAGLLTWREVRPRTGDGVTRGLLAVSSLVLAATMVLALSWALGEATGLPHLPIGWMAATHGVANALGFALCAVLAWRRLAADAAPEAVGPLPGDALPIDPLPGDPPPGDRRLVVNPL
jgi:hypothetical protein